MPWTDERRRSHNRGMALAIAIFALAVIGATVAGGFMAGVLEHQSGRTTLYLTQAAEAGEAELRGLLVSIPSATLLVLPLGDAPLDLGTASPGVGLTVERQVSRLGENLFLIRVRGHRLDADGGALASRGIGMLVRVVPDSLSGSDKLVPIHRGWLQLH